MAINRFHQFHAGVKYYNGAGCLVCGTNIGPCIDLGVEDAIDGAIVLCEDHARECGVFAGMVQESELGRVRAECEARLEQASADRLAAVREREEAAKDREVVERILGRLREADEEKAKAKPATPRRDKLAPRAKLEVAE